MQITVTFLVLCNRYFSAGDLRYIRCQFVADVKENPGGFQSFSPFTATACKISGRKSAHIHPSKLYNYLMVL